MSCEPQIAPLGDRGLVVEFSRELSLEANAQALAFAAHVAAASCAFVTDVVPSLSSVGLHYRPEAVPLQRDESPYAAFRRIVVALLGSVPAGAPANRQIVTIPVCYGGEFGPDLPEVAAACGLTVDTVIELHANEVARVLMLCFAPGHAQLGIWDARLSVSRRPTPRLQVAPGSVAIANRQTVIYPFALPAGWNVIGRTPLKLFDARRETPCLLRPGLSVRFVSITSAQFAAHQEPGS